VLLDISHIDQIGFGVADIDRAEDFYGRALGLRKLLRVGDLTFFECDGIRLLLEKRRGPGAPGARRHDLSALCRYRARFRGIEGALSRLRPDLNHWRQREDPFLAQRELAKELAESWLTGVNPTPVWEPTTTISDARSKLA
jgi:catechol 2,3-dioxygenase-like lactoylglutathione lyase family enzyme